MGRAPLRPALAAVPAALRAALLLLLSRAAHGQCYLEDTEALCSVCWETGWDKETTSSACPRGAVRVRWDIPLPEEMVAHADYPVEYTLFVDSSRFQIVPVLEKGEMAQLPHSNIHSCIMTNLACTPFVANSPGLSTHTAAQWGNLTMEEGFYVRKFSAMVSLPESDYTVIAHNRFFIHDLRPSVNCTGSCLMKVDTAVGIIRRVVKQEAATSMDAYVGTGVVALSMLLMMGSMAWAVRHGKLDFDRIIDAIMREEVTLSADCLFSVGDIIAYSISFRDEILPSDSLKEIVPAAVLFLATGWLATGVTTWQIFRKVRICLQRRKQKRMQRGQGQHHESEESELTATPPQVGAYTMNLAIEVQVANTHVIAAYASIVTMLLEDVPLSIMAIYVLLNSEEEVHVLVVLTLVTSSILVGIKVTAMLNLKQSKRNRSEKGKAFSEHQKRLSKLSSDHTADDSCLVPGEEWLEQSPKQDSELSSREVRRPSKEESQSDAQSMEGMGRLKLSLCDAGTEVHASIINVVTPRCVELGEDVDVDETPATDEASFEKPATGHEQHTDRGASAEDLESNRSRSPCWASPIPAGPLDPAFGAAESGDLEPWSYDPGDGYGYDEAALGPDTTGAEQHKGLG